RRPRIAAHMRLELGGFDGAFLEIVAGVCENARQLGNVRYDTRMVLSVEAAPAKHVGPQPLGYDDVAMDYGASVVCDVVHVVGFPTLLRVSVPNFAESRRGCPCR